MKVDLMTMFLGATTLYDIEKYHEREYNTLLLKIYKEKILYLECLKITTAGLLTLKKNYNIHQIYMKIYQIYTDVLIKIGDCDSDYYESNIIKYKMKIIIKYYMKKYYDIDPIINEELVDGIYYEIDSLWKERE